MKTVSFVSAEPIDKGWSGDKKYRVQTADGRTLLLRLSPVEQLARKQEECIRMRQAAALGVPLCCPVEVGTCPEGTYSLYEWIDGEEAEAAVPRLAPADAYRYGVQAGRYLKQLHTLPAPAGQEPWDIRYARKIDHKLALYAGCPLKYDGGEIFLAYIQHNRRLIQGRPQCFQHGDYHIGNMVLQGGRLIILDFDRFDYGDPWEEFNRIVWCAQKSPSFAAGMVDGYFDGTPPSDFWRLLALYIAVNTLSSLPWAIPFGQAEIDTMQRQAGEVLAWYDHMRCPVPAWYTEGRTAV